MRERGLETGDLEAWLGGQRTHPQFVEDLARVRDAVVLPAAELALDERPLGLLVIPGIYVVFSAAGFVLAGWLPSAGRALSAPTTSRRMLGFDADKDELVQLLVVPRPLSLQHDVYAIIRRRAGGGAEPVFARYRLTVGTQIKKKDGQPQIYVVGAPEDQVHGGVKPEAADKPLPAWLQDLTLHWRAGVDPFQAPPRDLVARTQRLSEPKKGFGRPLVGMVLDDNRMVWGTDGDRLVVDDPHVITADLELQSWAACGAVAPDGGTVYVGTPGASHEAVIAVDVAASGVVQAWRHKLSSAPVAVAALPPSGGLPERARVLVALRDARLVLLEHVGDAPRRAWERILATDLSSVDDPLGRALVRLQRCVEGTAEDPSALSALVATPRLERKSAEVAALLAPGMRGLSRGQQALVAALLAAPTALREALRAALLGAAQASDEGLRDLVRRPRDVALDPAVDRRTRLSALAVLATARSIVDVGLAAHASGFVARFAGRVGPSDAPILLLAGRRELLAVAWGPRPAWMERAPVTLEGRAIVRHLSVLELSDGERLAVVGGQSGRAGFVDARGAVRHWVGPFEATCWGGGPLDPRDGVARHLLAWSTLDATFLEVVRVSREDGAVELEQECIVQVPDLSARTCAVLRGGAAVALGDRDRAKVVVLSRPLDRGTRSVERSEERALHLSAAPRAIAFHDGTRRLLVGTEDGLIWCFAAGAQHADSAALPSDLAWAYQARRSVRAIDVDRDTGHVAVVASEATLVVLDRDGRRLRREGVDEGTGSARWVVDGAVRHLVLTDANGGMRALRWSEDEELRDWLARLDAVPEAERRAIADPLVDALTVPIDEAAIAWLDGCRDRAARRAFLVRAVRVSVGDTLRFELARRATLRELSAMFEASLESADWGAELLRALEARIVGVEDDGPRARMAAWVNALRHGAAADLVALEARLRMVPREVLAEPWGAVEAARIWWARFRRVDRSGAVDLRTRALFELPPDVVAALALRSVDDAERRWLRAVAAQRRRDMTYGLGDLAELAEATRALDPAEVPVLLGAVMDFLVNRDPESSWRDRLVGLIRATAKGAGAGATHLARWLRGVHELDLIHKVPDEGWRYARERHWLSRASEVAFERPDDPWAAELVERVEATWRAIIADRVAALEAAPVRAVPTQISVLRRPGGRLVVELEVIADGLGATEDVRVEVDLMVGRAQNHPLATQAFRRKRFKVDEPPERVVFEVEVPPRTSRIALVLRVCRGPRVLSEYRHDHAISREPHATVEAALDGIPSARARAVRRLLDARVDRPKVALLVVADGLGASALLRDLRAHGAAMRAPDGVLAELGPGRANPRGLTLETVAPALGLEEDGLVVLAPADDTVSRLLAAEHAALWASVGAAIAKSKARLAWVVGPERAHALLRALPGDPAWINLCRLESEAEVTEGARWWSAAMGADEAEAHDLLARVDGDLRVAARVVGRGGTDEAQVRQALVDVALEDLSALDARAATRLVMLGAAVSVVPVRELAAGMLPAEDVAVSTRQAPRPRVVRAGQELARGDLEDASWGAEATHVRCRGVGRWQVHWGHLEPLAPLLSELGDVDRALERVGLVVRAGGLLRARTGFWAAVAAASGPEATPHGILRGLLAGRSPVEALTLGELGRGNEPLRRLMAPHADSHLLREGWPALARAWTRGGGRALLALGGALFSSREGRGLPPGPEAALLSKRLGAAADVVWSAADGLVLACVVTDDPGARALPEEWVSERTLVLLGPGVERWPRPPRSRNVAVLRERDVRAMLDAADGPAALRAAIRAQRGLLALSPFQPAGALPPDSPVFVGRREVIGEILGLQPDGSLTGGIRERSYLILGSRQIGKTSVLNRLAALLSARPEFAVAYADLQGVPRGQDARFRVLSSGLELATEKRGDDWLHAFQRKAGPARLPVVLLNEVDGVVQRDPDFVARLRGLNDGRFRFIMVGYAAMSWRLGDVKGPLWRFAATSRGPGAINLSEFTREESLELVGKLCAPPLELRWADGDQDRGPEAIIQRAYNIPWAIQELCVALLRRLDGEGRTVLRADDVFGITAQPILDQTDRLVLDFSPESGGAGADARHWATRALLESLALELYFDSAEVRRPDLLQRDPVTLAFTAAAAREALLRVARRLVPARAEAVARYADGFHFERTLDGLCLTLILAPAEVSSVGERRYCFKSHLYPLELARLRGSSRGGDPMAERLEVSFQNLLGRIA